MRLQPLFGVGAGLRRGGLLKWHGILQPPEASAQASAARMAAAHSAVPSNGARDVYTCMCMHVHLHVHACAPACA